MKEMTVTRRTSRLFKLPELADFYKSGILLVVARAMVLGGFPFGVACFAAFIGMQVSYLGVVAVAIGIYTAGGSVAKYVVACGLFWLYSELRLRGNKTVHTMTMCGVAVLLAGLPEALASGAALYEVVMLVAESVLSACAYYVFFCTDTLFQSDRKEALSQEQIVCAVVTLGVLLIGLSGVRLPFGMEVSVILGILITLSVAMNTSLEVAASLGFVVGFLCAMNRPEAVLLSGVFGISAIFANLLKGFGKLGVSGGFLLGVTVCLLYLEAVHTLPLKLTELFLSCIIYAAIPTMMHHQISSTMGAVFRIRSSKNDARIKRFLAKELKVFSKTFRDLANNFLKPSTPAGVVFEGPMSGFVDEVAGRACAGCERAELCWRDKLEETYNQMYLLFETMEQDGLCAMENLPLVFRNQCINPTEFVMNFQHVYELYKQNALWKGEISMGCGLVAKQYHELSDMLRTLSREIEGGFCFREEWEKKIANALIREGVFTKEISVVENIHGQYEVYVSPKIEQEETVASAVSEVLGRQMRVIGSNAETGLKLIAKNQFRVELSVRQRAQEEQEVSGDTLECFETDTNKYFVILCDGMGSGDAAQEESRKTVKMLAKFLKAGMDKEVAVNMINATMALKLERERFTTVDLVEVDLCTGDVEFLKVGAAESYVRHKNKVEAVEAKTLPIGMLEEAKPVVERRKLTFGDCIVLVSDGIGEAGHGLLRGEWIKNLLQKETEPQTALTDTILDEAARKVYPKLSDDMTVVTMRIQKAEVE